MTDERYVYFQDLKQKNSTKSGAYHRRSGKRSHYVGLPSDHLTTAEKKRRNGPVESVKLNAPMTFAELKKLTPTMQFLYLDNLINKYKARRLDIVTMLGISQSCWAKYSVTVPGKLIFGTRRKSPSPEWIDFISPKPAPETPAPAEPVDTPAETKAEDIQPIVIEKPVFIPKPEVNPYKVTLSLEGTPSQLADLIAVLTDRDTAYNFKLTITADRKEDADD